ncbi:substrate-binding domain-containing protein [Mangrovicella endophytica]|uniref:LacI family DNA-binding transcriptional regulator n=1 Tax=Mangrovicella endophytica TaxID=2066697 RepID=UPI001300034C|nr:substrate-binding domain-containing protein [Mangrovicella endophytica]
MTKKASLSDVAAAAGASVATVSRVLNNPSIVRAELRERVLRAARELGYVPHGAARALASNRTRTIGVVVPTLGISVFAKGVEAMQDRLNGEGYRLVVANSRYDPDKEYEAIRSLITHGVDGLILVGNERSPESRRLLRTHACPVVVTFVHEASEDYPAVGFDNFASAYDMTRYLLSEGHRVFSVMTSPTMGNDRIRARRDGALQGLKDAGTHAQLGCIVEVPYTMEAGRGGLRQVLQQSSATTCLICTTDVIAVGALAEAKEMGLVIPDALSIAGYDGLDFAAYLSPGLTTITVPAAGIGTSAAESMIDILAGRTPRANTVLEAALAIRDSTGAPPAHPG